MGETESYAGAAGRGRGVRRGGGAGGRERNDGEPKKWTTIRELSLLIPPEKRVCNICEQALREHTTANVWQCTRKNTKCALYKGGGR